MRHKTFYRGSADLGHLIQWSGLIQVGPTGDISRIRGTLWCTQYTIILLSYKIVRTIGCVVDHGCGPRHVRSSCLTLPLNVVAGGRDMTYAGLVEGGFCRIIFPSLQLARGHVTTQYRERKEVLHNLATGLEAKF